MDKWTCHATLGGASTPPHMRGVTYRRTVFLLRRGPRLHVYATGLCESSTDLLRKPIEVSQNFGVSKPMGCATRCLNLPETPAVSWL